MHFTLEQVMAVRRQSGRRYEEFLRVPSMSAGLYVLPAGAVDEQEPHTEDEIYYVVAGTAMMTIGAEDIPVGAGSILFVEAGVEHRFHSIVEELSVLVFFAPAEGGNS
jgi:mannose-6-phosphate isomerase-like protein (cupin superfamily)